MGAQHTPGPWEANCDDVWDTHANGALGIPLFRSERGADRSWGRQIGWPEIEANCRVAAAAPELLDALYEALGDHIDWQSKARAAIAKAKGGDA